MDPIFSLPVYLLSMALVAVLAAWIGWYLGRKAGSQLSEHEGGKLRELEGNARFLEGKEAGKTEAYSDFGIVYKPFVDRKDALLKSEATTGYEMQLFVKGLPVGDPTRRVLERDMKVDKRTTLQLIDTVVAVVQPQVAMLRAANLVAQVVTEKGETKTTKQLDVAG